MSESFEEVIARSSSLADALAKLGRARVGSNYKWVREKIQDLGIDTSHFTRENRGRREIKDILVKGSSYQTGKLKVRLLEKGVLDETCEECGIGPEWNGKPLVLRLDHINGVRDDHRLKNLRLLCPNCDSQSSTFCGRNKSPAKQKVSLCPSCGSEKSARSNLCRTCFFQSSQKGSWPSWERLKEMLREGSVLSVAREIGVSDNAVRKHCRVRGYELTRSGLRRL